MGPQCKFALSVPCHNSVPVLRCCNDAKLPTTNQPVTPASDLLLTFPDLPLTFPDLFPLLTQVYSDCLGQAVLATFREAFPKSDSSFGDDFKTRLLNVVTEWITGRVLSQLLQAGMGY